MRYWRFCFTRLLEVTQGYEGCEHCKCSIRRLLLTPASSCSTACFTRTSRLWCLESGSPSCAIGGGGFPAMGKGLAQLWSRARSLKGISWWLSTYIARVCWMDDLTGHRAAGSSDTWALATATNNNETTTTTTKTTKPENKAGKSEADVRKQSISVGSCSRRLQEKKWSGRTNSSNTPAVIRHITLIA